MATELEQAFQLAFDHLTPDRTPGKIDEGVRLFHRDWFREKNSLMVVFRKNAERTNIQFAELAALISTHARSDRSPEGRGMAWQFQSYSEFRIILRELLEIEWDDAANGTDRLCELYGSYFDRLVLLDEHNGSAVIHFPPHVVFGDEQRAKLCRESGYIHSVGRALLTRNLQKVNAREITAAIDRVARDYKDAVLNVVVFSHEGHDDVDRPWASELRDGLDDLKLFARRVAIGDRQLLEIINSSCVGSDRVKLHFRKVTDPSPMHSGDASIFVITDRDVGYDPKRGTGARRYLKMYLQEYVNRSQFQQVAEHMPGWVLPHTMPNDLALAMINLTRPLSDSAEFLDPFGGVGTTAIAASLVGFRKVTSQDLDLLSVRAAKDNLEFFRLSPAKRDEVFGATKLLVETDAYEDTLLEPDGAAKFASLSEPAPGDDDVLTQRIVDHIGNSLGLAERLALYLVRRANEAVFEFPTEAGANPQLEANRKAMQVRMNLDKDVAKIQLYLRESLRDQADGAMGEHSRIVVPQIPRDAEIVVKHGDAQSLKPQSVDVIVCDPPYGVNTGKNTSLLSELYARFIKSAVSAIRPGGQLVVCVADDAFLRSTLPAFTRPWYITKQVLAEADAAQRTVSPHRLGGNPENHYSGNRAPYYWVADKALRRAILHFKFLD